MYVILFIVVCLSVVTADVPVLTYWHNWATADGETHLTQCNLTSNWISHPFGPGQPPIYTNTLPYDAGLTWFWTPAMWNTPGVFHPNPVVQFGIWFQGEMRFEATDGTVAIIKPGILYFGDDVGSKGHHSQNISPVVALSAMVQFKGATGTGPCWVQ